MNRHFESIRYYNEHAEEYVASTIGVVMEALYQPFLELVPSGGRILDAGCGSGRDTKAFLERGYDVTAIDASEKMVAATTRLTEMPAQQLLLQEIEFRNEFDGIWACASLLHLRMKEIDGVLIRFENALRLNGICYTSFKEGVGEHLQGKRRFTHHTSTSLKACLARHPGFKIIRIWTSDDARPGRTDRWVNALMQKVQKDSP